MKAVRDEAWQRFAGAGEASWFNGQRIKRVRHEPLSPGGRALVTLFEQVDDEGRPHPRLRCDFAPADDPAPGAILGAVSGPAPTDAEAFEAWLRHELLQARPRIDDVPDPAPDEQSPGYRRLSITRQRIARFFTAATAALNGWLSSGALPAAQAAPARLALRRVEAEAYAGELPYDNVDTGTYHSFGHDAPFVHYLESILGSLPALGSEAFALLEGEQQESVRRQREQAQAHLDWLMRHKYANAGISETDIEKSLGGVMIERETRHVVSEPMSSRSSAVPRFEILRIAPDASHEHAGAWVYRDAAGVLHLEDGGQTVEVADAQLRAKRISANDITFRRDPQSPRLRKGMRFDWDSSGWVQTDPIGWISWAGHCDIKAIMESLGIGLQGGEEVLEYRSDVNAEVRYTRSLLLEMVASVMELGSVYERFDGTGTIVRGIHHFGGARNDSRPDRLQFKGRSEGRSFRWPISGRKKTFTAEKLETEAGVTEGKDLDQAFSRYVVDEAAHTFAPNPRFVDTTEGDYNIIDVSGSLLTATIIEDSFDSETGFPTQEEKTITIDLREPAEDTRSYLGTLMEDAGERVVNRFYLDRKRTRIEMVPYRYDKRDGRYQPVRVAGETAYFPMREPLLATLSREASQDDPALFQALLDLGFRQGQNICADTDMEAEVWNGVVTWMRSKKKAENREARTERWLVELRARFGSASLEYLVRRSPDGEPEAYCPIPATGSYSRTPDFLWQDLPDVGSKGVEGADWVVNRTMLERSIVDMRRDASVPGGKYVYDDHIKNVYELIFSGLGGYRWTIVHQNKRYGFKDEASWRAARDKLANLRAGLRFEP